MSTAVANGENRLAGAGLQPAQTELMVPVKKDPGAILALAQKAENPIEFMAKMGKMMAQSGMLGVNKEERGATLLLICMTEGKSPLQVISEFHIMDDGKLTKKAEWVLARFRQIGGKFWILKDGTDGKEASYRFAYLENDVTFTYTIEDAKLEGLVKPNSRWVKNPPSMLRARVITGGVGMVAPEVKAGFNTEEELEGQTDGPVPSASTAARGRPAKDKTEPATNAATSATASQATTTQQQQTAESAQPGEVIDAEFSRTDEPAATGTTAASATTATTTEQPPFEATEQPAAAASTAAKSPEDHKKECLIMDIVFQLGRLGMTQADYEAGYFAKYKDFETLEAMPIARLEEQLTKVRNVADQKAAKN